MSLNKSSPSAAPRLIVSREERLDFGKYKGWTIAEIMEEQPDYLVWLQQNVESFDLHSDLLEEAERDSNRTRWEVMSGYFWRSDKDMALHKDDGKREGNFLTVKHGALCLESDAEREGYEQVDVFNPTTQQTQDKWVNKFRDVYGMIRDIEWYDRENGGVTFQGIKIHLEDDGERYSIDLPFGKRPFDAFSKFAENIDFTKPITFLAWPDKSNELITAFAAKQDGEFVRQKYTRDDPGECPAAVQNARTKKWSFDAQREWLLDRLLDHVIPQVKELNSSPEPEYTGDEVQHVAPKKRKAVKAGASSQTDVENWQDAEAAF